MRVFHRNKAAIYPHQEWQVTEVSYEPRYNHRNETIFSLGNGYMGLRGTFEEGVPSEIESTPGTYINGIYETSDIHYGEFAPNLPRKYQTMINVTNWHSIRLFVGKDMFSMFTGEISDYYRTLDLRNGKLVRHLIWTSPSGKKVKIHIERLISQVDQHVGAIRYEVTPLNFSGAIRWESEVSANVTNKHHLANMRILWPTDQRCENGVCYVMGRTRNTGFAVGCAASHVVKGLPAFEEIGTALVEPGRVQVTVALSAMEGKTYSLEKFAAVATSREVPPERLAAFVMERAEAGAGKGFSYYEEQNSAFMQSYWDDSDVEVEGDPALQQGLRFNAFQLLQSTGRDGRTNVAAKGLTGEYYEGHYFWDTEIYIVPYYLYTHPELARQLLLYRYGILDAARENAKRMRDLGALFAWRTINGHEASGNFLGSTVQYHINADVAYAIGLYWDVTGDDAFIADYGAEILFETARLWAGRGSFNPRKGGKYCINEVCGPDEYKPGVNNNCYTNFMAKKNLELALSAYELMKSKYPGKLDELSVRLNLRDEEIFMWRRCSENMYLPYDAEAGIHPQDDSFMEKDPIDVDSIPDSDIPLVSHWHPLTIWRYQVIKQADVVLLLFLLGDRFSTQEKRRNYDYYEPKTTHDSSLSACIYSIIASEIGYHDDAYNYFMQTARLDLDDYNKNAWQGVHTACLAGSWMCIVNGFAGMRVYGRKLHFRPILPTKWKGYRFKVKFQGRQLHVQVDSCGTTYKLLSGDPLVIYHDSQPHYLEFGREIRVISTGAGELESGDVSRQAPA